MQKLHEECGVFGAYSLSGANVSEIIYYGLSALQHRGQEACGIAVTDTAGSKIDISYHKGLGLVNEVFSRDNLSALKGNLGVGHVRYSTTGASTAENAQPLVLNYVKGMLAIAHNGNLVNADELRNRLAKTGAISQTTTDSEAIAYQIARARVSSHSIEEAVKKASKKIRGAYALVIISPRKLIAVRDPMGIKPLCLGKVDDTYIVASESCAITAVGGVFIRDIEAGEILTITKDAVTSDKSMRKSRTAHCIFEYIYFAREDSKLDSVSVYESRIKAGRILAKAYPADADIVVGVPDSGIAAAQGYSYESGIPFALAFHKNSYVGRTFIKPEQSQRVSGVKIKLSVLESVVKGKRIILVDDSIVRGTTSANIIKMLKAAGAKEVHMRISSPPFVYPCFYGTDVPSNEQLIASSHTAEEIAQIIGAQSLGYMRVEDLKKMVCDKNICTACFSGKYPVL